MFFKISVIKNFAIFTGKDLCCSLFFKKVAGLLAQAFIKKRLLKRVLRFTVFMVGYQRLRVFKQVKENGCCYRQISLDQDILKAWWILGFKFIHWGTLWWYITLILIFIGDNEVLNKIYFSNIKEKRLFLSLICIFTF